MRLLVLLIGSATPFIAYAAVPASTAQPSVAPAFQEPFSSEALSQLVVGLLVVIALIFILSWLFKRFSGLSPVTKYMQVLGVLPLSTREKAVLIKVGEQQILLGVAPGRVSHLHTFDKDAGVDVTKPESFAEKLNDVMGKKIGKGKDE
ncbi:flagellar biosynthetic protein FliO [uncultured Neptuniibacter sp.]|uniref:flagellar biosynthetic protein FliO n=1 Tax=uncultured Neptuniibacter sp. TaxID=502143 RepID=UPI00260215BE|nr:flagellar biosynthetic protein FliO [uncultured Neptuniibacter sp.]